MAWVAAPAGTLGGLGLILLGVHVAERAARSGLGGTLRRRALATQRGGPRAYGLGLLTALFPSAPWQGRALVALTSSGLLSLPALLQAGVGSLAALAVAAAVLAWSVAVPVFGAGALAALGAGAVLRWLSGLRALRPAAELAVGWGALASGARLLSQGLAGDGVALRLDALPLGVAGQVAVVFLAGLALGALARASTPLLALAIAGAGSGALQPTSAAALACAALAAAGADAWLALPSERGDGRRAALAIGGLHLAGAVLGLFLLTLCLPLLVAATGTGEVAALRVAGFVVLHVACATALWLPFQGKLRALVEEVATGDEGLGADSLDLPELLVAGAEQRHERALAVARNLARAVLGGEGVTGFRLDHDRAEVQALAAEVEGLWVRAGADGLPEDLVQRLAIAAREAGLLPRLVDELTVLRAEIGQQDGYLTPDLRRALHERQIALLCLLEGALAARASDRSTLLAEDGEILDADLAALERHLVGLAASGALVADLALALLWRLARLRDLCRQALAIAHSPGWAAPGAAEDGWWRLAAWGRERVASLGQRPPASGPLGHDASGELAEREAA